ncbi:MAG TPA: phosphate regulon sensor histidine kinase PhoR [Burkholderiaceae bacterium]|nr:phosphate regulon sensor histidine kinase PhoR [Burkholderiaceae bacterium]
MLKTLISLGLWALAGWLFGSWLGETSGWIVFTLGLIIMILVSGVQHSQITRWVRNIEQPPPPSVGPWDNVLAAVYRKLRKDETTIRDLERNVQGIMQAAEALPDGAVTLNDRMQITWCNQRGSEHLGLNLETDRDLSILNILRAPAFAKYARQSRWPEPLLLHLNRNGNPRAIMVQLTRYGYRHFLLVSRDVTQLEKLETTRKDFVANVSHELRTPLTVLAGFLETLRDTPDEALTQEQKAHYSNLMMDETRRMQAIVDDLLTLSALESTPAVSGKPVDVAALINSALEQAKALSDGQHQFIENIDNRISLIGSEAELDSAFSNLLTNAVRYTMPDGIITVSWYITERGTACYSVQDTGIGISSKDLSRITERFYRVEGGRPRKPGRTGLGLAISKHVALRHDAELEIESRLGAGSLFSIEFPVERVINKT